MTCGRATVRALVPPGRWPEAVAAAAGRTLPGRVGRAVGGRDPDAPVLDRRRDTRRRVVTAATLDGRTAALAAVLAERGVGAGRPGRCGAPAPRSPPLRPSSPCVRRGAVLVPLSPSATGAEIAHVVGDARPVAGHRRRRVRHDAFGAGLPVVGRRRAGPRGARTAVPGAGPARQPGRRRADRLHVGHDRQARRGPCTPTPPSWPASRRCSRRGSGRPEDRLVLAPAALPRARSVRRPVRHADRGRVGRRVRPLRRGGRPRRRAGEHHVLRRPHHVPPVGRVGSGVRARRRCASASRARRRWPPTCGTGWPPTAWRCWSATA